ncbi:hypothetical protein EAF04_003516 [Stromatinia cepivora]|nr:hypothetical protein EAF04_003516 [Stromatinia cepivora]
MSPHELFGIDTDSIKVNPPSYDSHRGPNTPPLEKLQIPLQNLPTSPQIFSNKKSQDSKANSVIKIEEEQVLKKGPESRAPADQLFSSPHNRLSFKIKSLFRSKDSLAAEMKTVLGNTSSVLEAFLIQGTDIRPIPHSAFHSLEATHMRTILSQLNDNTWFETFSSLTRLEHSTLDTAIYPCGPKHLRREVVALKVLQENKNNAWMRLIAGKLRTAILPQHSNGRVILAILREHLVDGERRAWVAHSNMPDMNFRSRLHPPHLLSPPAMIPNIRSPTTAAPDIINGPRFIGSDGLRPPPTKIDFETAPSTQGHFLPPISQARGPPPPPPPPGRASPSARECYFYTDAEAFVALTTYSEYTLRLYNPNDLFHHHAWSHVNITQESNALPEILARVNSFINRGCSIIDAQLRLTDQQALQTTRLLEDIRLKERDYRFEWCWVELSLYDSMGEIDHGIRGNAAHAATIMHLIARRTLKREYKASDVYGMLTRGTQMSPPPPPLPPGFHNTLSHLSCSPPPPPTMPRPPPPPPPPPGAGPPVFIEPFRPRARGCRRTRGVSMSDLNSGSSGSDSDVTYDSRRGRMRRRRCNNGRLGRDYSVSESSDSGNEGDVIRIPVVLKRGDDLVEKLLDLWTPSVKIVEKSMEKSGERS